MSWIQTHPSNIALDVMAPTPEMIRIEDIALSLSHQCRFGGHVRAFYSVAQHAVHVSEIVPQHLAFPALMHDAAEYGLVDLPTPIKWELSGYKEMEQRLWLAIAACWQLPEYLSKEIKLADAQMLMAERRDLKGPPPHKWAPEFEAIVPDKRKVKPWGCVKARRKFLERFNELLPEWMAQVNELPLAA